MPIHLNELHASFFLISLVSFVPAVEIVIISPTWGGLLDKTGKGYRIIFASLQAQAVEFSILPFLSSSIQFVLVVALTGVFTSSFISVYSAIATLSSQHYGRAIGGF